MSFSLQSDNIAKSGLLHLKSPLFFNIFEDFSVSRKFSVVDAGSHIPSTLDFLSNYRCKVYASTNDNIEGARKSSNIDTWFLDFDSLAKSYDFRKTGLDVVLLWDAINYMTGDQLKSFIASIRSNVSGRTLLHAYIYNTQFIPDNSPRYYVSEEEILVEQTGQNTIESASLYQATLEKYLFPFYTVKSVMLSSGIQEYVFCCDPAD